MKKQVYNYIFLLSIVIISLFVGIMFNTSIEPFTPGIRSAVHSRMRTARQLKDNFIGNTTEHGTRFLRKIGFY